MESSKILLKDGQTVDLVDGRIADGDITSWNNKLNVDGSNATNAGVTAMMKKVSSGTGGLDDNSTYFGDSNDDHSRIVRRPIVNIWDYIKDKVKTLILGSVGSVDKPIYLENGIPKIATGVSTKTDLNNLTDVVNNHTTEIGQIEEDVKGIESSLTNKKDKQSANTFNGSSTKTVKTITQDVNGELNVEFENIDYPDYNISSSDDSINVSTSEGVTDLTLPNDVVRDSNYVHIEGATEVPLKDGITSVGVSTKYAREDHIHPTDTSREAIANKTTVILGTSNDKYPTDEAVAKFVNSSIATNTANYISNNGNPFTSVEQLNTYTGTVTNNDYAFVTGTDSEGNTYYDRYKATVKGSSFTWSLEYRLNNSSFTAAQWSAINSGITSALVAKIHDHSNKDVLDGITSTDVANWNSKMDRQTVGNISEPVYIENGIAKIATNVATTGNLSAKLNVDGSNATNAGITTMLKSVPVNSSELSSTIQIFTSTPGSSEVAKRPIGALAAYIKNDIGSAGSTETPIYLENGVPKVCTLVGVPYTFVNYGKANGYGVFVGGNTKLGNTTRCSCTFLVSVSSNPDLMMHTYIGTFSFRGDLSNKVMKKELRCLTGAPKYPLRMAVVYSEDGKDSDGKPTYSVGVFVIPARKTDKYSNYRLTRIASSGFKWDVKKISDVDYDNCDAASKNVFMTQTAMIKDVANASATNDTSTVHIYYDDIICNNGSTEYSINIARLVIGKTYRFHIMKESQAATYLYNYGASGLGTVIVYYGDASKGVTSNARIALNGGGSGALDHTVTVARMTETQIYIIWGY